jgi:predicted thioredoxin/glutaredoxin
VSKALAELKVPAEVVTVTEIDDIFARGVMFTPSLVIDGKVVLQGKIAPLDQIKQLVKGG